MKIRIRDRGVPADHYVVAQVQLQFTKQNGISEIAIITDDDFSFLPDSEVDSIHRAIGANDQRLLLPAPKALKGVIGRDDGVGTDSYIRWQRSVGPSSSLFAFLHVLTA